MKTSRLSRKRSVSDVKQPKIYSFFEKSPTSLKPESSSQFTRLNAKESSTLPTNSYLPISERIVNGERKGNDDFVPDTPIAQQCKKASQNVWKTCAVASDSDTDVIPPTPEALMIRKRKVLSNSVNIYQCPLPSDDVIPDTPPDKISRKSQYFGCDTKCKLSSSLRLSRSLFSLHKSVKRMTPAEKDSNDIEIQHKENVSTSKLKISETKGTVDSCDALMTSPSSAKIKSSKLHIEPTSCSPPVEYINLLKTVESPISCTRSSCNAVSLDSEAEKKINTIPRIDSTSSESELWTSEQNGSFKSETVSKPINKSLEIRTVSNNDDSIKNRPIPRVSDIEDIQPMLPESLMTATVSNGDCLTDVTVVQPLAKDYNRHTVENIIGDFNEKHLTLKSEMDGRTRVCILKGFWAETQVQIGDTVNVLADFDDEQVAVIDSGHNLLVVNPDHLVSSTTVTAAVFCRRKAVLQEWFRGVDPGNPVMLIGTIIHQVFQQAMDHKMLSNADITKLISKLLKKPSNLEEMFKLQSEITESELRQQLEEFVSPISQCIRQSITDPLVTNGGIMASSIRKSGTYKDKIEVLGIRDIEENIWSPRCGLKGKLDMTIDVRINRRDGTTACKVLPLELKTGRPSFSVDHQGQVMLYSLISKDRRPDSEGGLLLYLRTGEMREILSKIHSEQGLMQLRNELVRHLSQPITEEEVVHMNSKNGCIRNGRRIAPLPEPLNNTNICSKCPYLVTCAVLHKTNENCEIQNSPSFDCLSQTAVSHLQQDEVQYFLNWCCCLFIEDYFQKTNNQIQMKNIWCSTAKSREMAGDCYSGMMLAEISKEDQMKNLHRFKRWPGHWNTKSLKSIGLPNLQSVIITEEKWKLIAIASGYVVAVTDSAVDIMLDRNLYSKPELHEAVFRIDAYSSQPTTTTCLSSLARLMSSDLVYTSLRKIVVHCPPPTIEYFAYAEQLSEAKSVLGELNPDQTEAVKLSLLSKDYLLIKGMPGCGKTSTIVAMICIFATLLNKTVLLASYTHTAVDNVLLKLKERNMKFLRLGKASSVDSRLLEYTAEHLLQNVNSLDEMKLLYKTPIIATTCSGSNHAIFKTKQQFDVCIVDEASQVPQPVCLGVLFSCKKFILVGDSRQLPPIVTSPEARRLGMQESLFCRLEAKHPSVAVKLSKQYRMNKIVMQLANTLTYENQMSHDSDTVANAVLELPNSEKAVLEMATVTDLWLQDVGSTELVKSVLFLNTDGLVQSSTGNARLCDKICNKVECQLVCKVILFLNKAGLKYEDMGVISPYRAQISLLKQLLWKQHEQQLTSGDDGFEDLEVNTIDKYQGRDKEATVISFVKNSSSNKGEDEIIHDERRVNVAITRARKKIVMIGSMETLQRYQPLKNLIEIMKDEQKINLCEKKCSLELDAIAESQGHAK